MKKINVRFHITFNKKFSSDFEFDLDFELQGLLKADLVFFNWEPTFSILATEKAENFAYKTV